MHRPAWLPSALVALLACAVHLPTLGFGFVFDDEHLIVNNAFLREPWSALRAFGHHFWHATPFETAYYRPLAAASLALNGRLLGWSPLGFHLVNVLLHAANAVLLLRLARLIGARPMPATCAASLFALHPAAAWPVASIVARVDLLPALFVLLAWGSAARASATPAGLFFLAALLSKESAAAFLLVAVLALRRPRSLGDEERGEGDGAPPDAGRRRSGWLQPAMACFAALVVYLAARRAAGIPLLPGRRVIDPTTNPLAFLPLPGRAWAALELSGRYLLYLVLPVRFGDPRDYVSGPLPGPTSPGVLLSAAALIAVALVALCLWVRRSVLGLPIGFALFSFLPASNLFVPIGSLYAQNFLYLPLLGLSLAAGLALDRWGPRAALEPPARRRALWVAAPAFLLLALAAIREASIWRDAGSLFSAWAGRFPRYALAHSRLGVARLAEGDTAAAEKALRQAVRLDDRLVEAHYNLGVCLAQTARDREDVEEALGQTQAALVLAPDLVQARVNASRLLRQLDRPADAESQARAALELDPGFLPARLNLAEALFEQERFGEAAEEFGALVRSRPDDPGVRSPYVVALLRAGDLEAARAAALQARQDFPSLAWFDFCLARIAIRSGNAREAVDLLKVSFGKDPATRDWLERVEDFADLAGDPGFEAVRRSAGAR